VFNGSKQEINCSGLISKVDVLGIKFLNKSNKNYYAINDDGDFSISFFNIQTILDQIIWLK
jgi:hypothetical protein